MENQYHKNWDNLFDKIEKHIHTKQHSRYGYYMLAKANMDNGRIKAAESVIKQAIQIKKSRQEPYVILILSWIECCIHSGKLLKAANLYAEHISEFRKKKIYGIKLCRTISMLYESDFMVQERSFLKRLAFKRDIHGLIKSVHISPYNIVANLLLVVYYLKTHYAFEGIHVVLRECSLYKGVDDDLRWGILRYLSKEDYAIMENPDIISSFHFIPKQSGDTDFLNRLMEHIFKHGDSKKIDQAFNYLLEKKVFMTNQNLWYYIDYAREYKIYNMTLYKCCKQLMEDGWVNKTIVDTMHTLKNLRIISEKTEDDKMLGLFGY